MLRPSGEGGGLCPPSPPCTSSGPAARSSERRSRTRRSHASPRPSAHRPVTQVTPGSGDHTCPPQGTRVCVCARVRASACLAPSRRLTCPIRRSAVRRLWPAASPGESAGGTGAGCLPGGVRAPPGLLVEERGKGSAQVLSPASTGACAERKRLGESWKSVLSLRETASCCKKVHFQALIGGARARARRWDFGLALVGWRSRGTK